jgi:hypothetical protein
MKTCSTCGMEFDDTQQFCDIDGSRLIETAQPVSSTVLRCPVCAVEYPLTFSVCPVDGVPLASEQAAAVHTDSEPGEGEEPVFVTSPLAEPARPAQTDTPANESRIEREPEVRRAPAPAPLAAHWDEPLDDGPIIDYLPPVDTDPRAGGAGFRLLARVIVVALAVFGLAVAYVVYSSGSRKPLPAKAVQQAPATTASTTGSTFVPTPDEPVAEVPAEPEPAAATPPVDTADTLPKTQPKAEAQAVERAAARPAEEPSIRPQETRPQVEVTRPAQSPAPRLVDVSAPVASHSTGGRVNGNLIRVRSRRTASGVRYDLTFNLHEQSGGWIHWDRVTISTRSATGGDYHQALPFSHKLAPSGLLTFTVGVEMLGRTEADWRGRVVCTAFGLDNTGRPIRATFGANVAP